MASFIQTRFGPQNFAEIIHFSFILSISSISKSNQVIIVKDEHFFLINEVSLSQYQRRCGWLEKEEVYSDVQLLNPCRGLHMLPYFPSSLNYLKIVLVSPSTLSPKMASSRSTIIVTGAAGGIGTGWLHGHLLSPWALSHYTVYVIHPSSLEIGSDTKVRRSALTSV